MSCTGVMYPKYSNPIIEIYVETALKISDHAFRDRLALSCFSSAPNAKSALLGARLGHSATYSFLGFYAKYRCFYRARKKPHWEIHLRTEPTEKGSPLAIIGVVVDIITEVDMISGNLSIPISPTSRFVPEGIDSAVEACHPPPSSKSTILGTFWQTLVAGKGPSNYVRAPDEYSAIFALLFDSATGHSPSFPDQPSDSSTQSLPSRSCKYDNPLAPIATCKWR
ncbi:hypothetical protein BDR22DRAFT_596771 [Usnea florida]